VTHKHRTSSSYEESPGHSHHALAGATRAVRRFTFRQDRQVRFEIHVHNLTRLRTDNGILIWIDEDKVKAIKRSDYVTSISGYLFTQSYRCIGESLQPNSVTSEARTNNSRDRKLSNPSY
jgi:hypothetical protein